MKQLEESKEVDLFWPRRFLSLSAGEPFSWSVLSERGIIFRSKAAVEACRGFACDPFGIERDRNGILLRGPSGCGKTVLKWCTIDAVLALFWIPTVDRAKALACEAYEAGRYRPQNDAIGRLFIRSTTGADLAAEILASGKSGVDAVVAKYRPPKWPDRQIIFVDDVELLGSGDVLRNAAYRIFDALYDAEAPVFITSNLLASELVEIVGDRVGRRIFDLTMPYLMELGT